MSWNWVAVLGIIVIAWTVLRVTNAWMQVTMFKYVPESVKQELAKKLDLTGE